MNPWKAPADVVEMVSAVKTKNHCPRLDNMSIAVAFDDSKPFVKNKLNLGKVSKFSPSARLWQKMPHHFCLSIPSELWHSVLKASQLEAYLDLQLTRCEVEYIAETVEENGKKKPIKDEWGRVQYTQEIKLDDDGNPKLKVIPLDLEVFSRNVRKYGLWYDDLIAFKNAISASEEIL